ncbi:F-box protein PP2-B11-like [Lycium ferocissimum]|uniref:F-box protein PP2-B11-like n=1 Tax=Lycium ferocissimum TaxID=112874 RepID=UPI002814A83A|nr:F-box protein PP2-B11-like [Lycium ferocissimum]
MDTPEHYWTWNYLHEPGCDVAELHRVCWLNIVGKIDSKRLTRKTSFGAYLVFKLNDQQHNLERAIASVRFVKEKAEGTGGEGYTVFISKAKEHGEHGIFPHLRTDEWMEIKLGEFFNNLGEDGDVEMTLMETSNDKWKSGLIVKGIDIRPN